MILNKKKSADGYYGIPVDINVESTWAFSPESVSSATANVVVDLPINEYDKYFTVIKGYGSLSFFGMDTVNGIKVALCSYTRKWKDGVDKGNSVDNKFCYILASRIDFSKLNGNYPSSMISIDSGQIKSHNLSGNEHLGGACICTSDEGSVILSAENVFVDACDRYAKRYGKSSISDNASYYGEKIGKYSMLSMVPNGSSPTWDSIEINGSTFNYLLVIYNGKYAYVPLNDFKGYNGPRPAGKPILEVWAEQLGKGIKPDVRVSKESIRLENDACLMTSEQAKNYTGTYKSNLDTRNYNGIMSAGTTATVVAHEFINGNKFLIVYGTAFLNYYIAYDSIVESGRLSLTPNSSIRSRPSDISVTTSSTETIGSNNPNDVSLVTKSTYSETESKTSKTSSSDSSGIIREKWYDVTLEAGKYPDDEMNNITGAAYLENKPDDKLPSGWGDTDLFAQSNYYNLTEYTPNRFTPKNGGHNDNRQIYKINRFNLLTNESGLSTKSFIFMTKPDLNIYKLDEYSHTVIPGQMNPSLKLNPVFKYIGRNKDIGWNILDSLEYWGTGSGDTPWLSIITNQAEGYSPIDRKITTTEVGETYHGNKVIYGKHDFEHSTAGTISIPFSERRDLSLYYTLKLWTEYIHMINLGLTSPNPIHIKNAELDYAVSLYYIQTDETMENIIYWEKLTGVFPLKSPDSFFDWNKGEHGKNMEYTIDFAYSMRSVLEAPDLYELDRLYFKYNRDDDYTIYPKFKDFNNDYYQNPYIAKLAAYFNKQRGNEKDEFGQNLWINGESITDETQFNQFVTNLTSGIDDISKYYYDSFVDQSGVEAEFLANYIPQIQSHGVPYVKGPFVVPHPDYNGGKFLLKWV